MDNEFKKRCESDVEALLEGVPCGISEEEACEAIMTLIKEAYKKGEHAGRHRLLESGDPGYWE